MRVVLVGYGAATLLMLALLASVVLVQALQRRARAVSQRWRSAAEHRADARRARGAWTATPSGSRELRGPGEVALARR